MRARTIGQIATLIAGHVGGTAPAATSPVAASIPTPESGVPAEADLDALSGEDIDRLLGDDENPLLEATPHV
jgi:hypothetical protein